jgi:hypothetical protein
MANFSKRHALAQIERDFPNDTEALKYRRRLLASAGAGLALDTDEPDESEAGEFDTELYEEISRVFAQLDREGRISLRKVMDRFINGTEPAEDEDEDETDEVTPPRRHSEGEWADQASKPLPTGGVRGSPGTAEKLHERRPTEAD